VADTVCFIHAGTERTGTSSIQHFLGLNAEKLAEQGIWVPRALAVDPDSKFYNHVLLSTASRIPREGADDLQRGLGLFSIASIVEHRNEVQRRLAEEFESLNFRPSMIIVSNEHIHGRLRHDDDLENARALLAPYCKVFRVIVYLRSQWELAESVANLAVFSGATELRLVPIFDENNGFDPVLGVDRVYFDYEAFIRRLVQAFGQEAVSVRIFSPLDLRKENVIDDFAYQIGIDTDNFIDVQRENTSIEWTAALFLAVANRYFQKRTNEQATRERLVWLLRQAYPKRTHRYTPGASYLMDSFEESNERVRERWFPSRPRLFPKFDGASGEDPRFIALSESAYFDILFNLFRVIDNVPSS
jgi:hypothetical protein